MQLKNQIKAYVGTALIMAASFSHAAGMTLPSELTDALASVATVGAGVFAIAVGIKIYKWLRGAL